MFGMDSFEFNKIAGAVLGTLLFMMGVGILGEMLFSPRHPQVAGYALPEAESAPAASAGPAKESVPLPVLLAKADPAKGQAQAKVCTSCHAFEKGAPNKIGPGLWNVVNSPMGSHEGFKYSAALQERKAKGDKWTFESLNAFITNPKGYVSGTSMGFAGLKEDDKRADVIAYLRSLSDSPAELPKP